MPGAREPRGPADRRRRDPAGALASTTPTRSSSRAPTPRACAGRRSRAPTRATTPWAGSSTTSAPGASPVARARGPSSGPTRRARPRYAGTIDLRPGAAPSAGELGFGLHPDARGRGLMSRAVRLVVAHAFATPVWGAPVTPRPLARHRRQLGLAPGRVGGGLHLPRHDPGQPPRPRGRRRGARHVDRQHHAGRPAARHGRPWFAAPRSTGERRPAAPVAARRRRRDRAARRPRRTGCRPGRCCGRETFAAWLPPGEERMSEGTAVDWCVADRGDRPRARRRHPLQPRRADRRHGRARLPVLPERPRSWRRQGGGPPRRRPRAGPGRRGRARAAPARRRDRGRQRGEQRRAAVRRLRRSSVASTRSTGSPTAAGATGSTGSCCRPARRTDPD